MRKGIKVKIFTLQILFISIFGILFTHFSINTLFLTVNNDIFMLNSGKWSKVTVISDDYTGWNNGTSGSPSIAIDNNGSIHVVWHDETAGIWNNGFGDYEIMHTNYTATGWSNATLISDDSNRWNDYVSVIPEIAIDINGNIHIVWQDWTDGEWGSDNEIMYANFTTNGWSNATVISDDYTGWNTGDSWAPSIAIDNYSNIHVVWYDETNGTWGTDFEIMYTNYTAAGWSNATVISDDYTGWNTGDSKVPRIAIDNNSNIHVVWWDETDGIWGSDIEIMYANHTTAGWSNATVISDDYTGWNNDESILCDIGADNNGNIYVVWQDDTNGTWGSDTEIMYTKYSTGSWLNATVISDDNTNWNSGESEYPNIAIDNNGNVHVVWQDDTDDIWGSDKEIMYIKYSKVSWNHPLVISDDNTDSNDGDSENPSIAIDNNGNVHVVWQDDTDGVWGTDTEIMYRNFIPESKESIDLIFLILLSISEQDSLQIFIPIIAIGIAGIVIVLIFFKRKK